MKYFYIFLLSVVVMEFAAAIVKGLIIGQSSNPWTGGNGCNLIGGDGRLPCCTPHDKSYKEGGLFIDRLMADLRLFACIWKQSRWGIVLAPIMFCACRFFGMWAFQYGKKRKL